MRTMWTGLALAGLWTVAGCAQPFEDQAWTGSCADSQGDLMLGTNALKIQSGALEGFEGEHDHYRAPGEVAFPSATLDAVVDVAVCTDADGCADPLYDFDADSVVWYFTNAANELVVLGVSVPDSKKAVSGTCSVYGGANADFAMAWPDE